MLSLLLDEMMSSVIADGVQARRPEISIQSIYSWRDGTLLSQPDRAILAAAAADGLTLVTFDVNTIMPLVAEWNAAGQTHAGVVFVDQWTIRPDDFGRLIRALEQLWDLAHHWDWTNLADFLRAPTD